MQKSEIYPVGIYLLKVNNESSRTRCVIRSKLIKKSSQQPHWNEDIKKHWCRSGASIVNFEKISHPFLVFHSWFLKSFAGWVCQQRSKYRQVKIMKHARTDGNYAILTKCVKLQHKKKPIFNLLSMESVGVEQTFMKFIEIFVLQE